MTDFIAHSNGIIVDCNTWTAWDVENDRQAAEMYIHDTPLDPEHLEEIERCKREYVACKAIAPIMLRMENAKCIESMSMDANLYWE